MDASSPLSRIVSAVCRLLVARATFTIVRLGGILGFAWLWMRAPGLFDHPFKLGAWVLAIFAVGGALRWLAGRIRAVRY